MKGNVRSARVGFALIDLLVLAGVGVLLVPLLAPVVRDASEQARIGQCLANLQGLMAATGAYLGDYGDFPFCAPGQVDAGGQINAICTWSYGGKTAGDFWRTADSGVFYVPSDQRVMNPYVLGAPVQPDLYAGGQLRQRTPIPRLQCPSDRYSHQRSFGSGLDVQPFSCYDDVGTSYQFNMHALNPETHGGGDGLLYNGTPDSDLFSPPGTWTSYGNILVNQVLARHSASFTMFLEDPMDWALAQRTQEIGNHGELGKHSVGYLDGHADYAHRDTRGWCGVGWEAINPEWVLSISSEPPRPVAYSNYFINCYPPYTATDKGPPPDSTDPQPSHGSKLRGRPADIPNRTGGEQ
jgi:hypothetical protein